MLEVCSHGRTISKSVYDSWGNVFEDLNKPTNPTFHNRITPNLSSITMLRLRLRLQSNNKLQLHAE